MIQGTPLQGGQVTRKIKKVASACRRRLLQALGGKQTVEADERHSGWHKRAAADHRQVVENQKGEQLDPAVIRVCDDYARDVFGWEGYADWLYAYSAMAGTFKEGWIPYNYYTKVVLPRTKQDMRGLSDLRVIESTLFDTDLFPTIACYANGLFTTKSFEIIPPDAVKEYLFQHGDRVVFKLHTSMQGRGVFVYTEEDFDVDVVVKAGNGVFQSYARQHRFFDQFNTNSVANLRLATVVDDKGQVSCRAGYLRFSLDAKATVSIHTSLKVPIDLATWQLHSEAYRHDWYAVTQKTESGFEFGGATIPGLDKSIAVVCDLQKKLPFCRSVGWDICIGPDEETQVLEWNTKRNSITFFEATVGPCFADLGWENLWKTAQ